MRNWMKTFGKWTALAVVAGSGLGIELAPTLAALGPQSCGSRIATALVDQSSCVAAAYADAQRIGGVLTPSAPRDASCAASGVL